MALSPADRRGITCLVVGGMGFSISDALTKLAMLSLPFGEVIALRNLFTSVLFLVLLAGRRELSHLKAAMTWPVAGRSLLDLGGTITFVLAISHVRLADSTAIVMSAPIFMTLLAIVVYGEKVGWHRWSAIILGITGVVFVTKPQPDSVSYWMLLAALAAICSAARDLVTRSIGAHVNSLAVAFCATTLVTLFGGTLSVRGDWIALDLTLFIVLAAAGTCYAFGMFFLVQAFRGDISVSLVSPFRYVMLFWSIGLGYLLFDETPDLFTLVGSVIIIASGLYVLRREMVLGRRLTATAPER